MKIYLVFFLVVFSVYFSGNWYIYSHATKALPDINWLKWAVRILYWALAMSFIASRIIERFTINWFGNLLIKVGSFWIAALLYLLLFVVLIDLVLLLNSFLGFLPSWFFTTSFKSLVLLLVVFFTSIIVIYGYFNASSPLVTRLSLKVDKKVEGYKQLKIAMVSDIHMGTMVGKNKVEAMALEVSGLRPDIIFLVGDIVAEDIVPVLKYDLGDHLRDLNAPLGVYAVTGNHEYIGGHEFACKYITDHGVILLRDSVVQPNGLFTVAGREDRDMPRFTGRPRLEVKELLKNADHTKLLILLDHQPYNLENAVTEGVDLQLSGHTHNGQMWPFNYLIKAIFELGWGYKLIEKTHFYVSSGYGTWGPPIRIGNHPEIVFITLDLLPSN